MDYTCENCVSRHTWDCDDGGYRCKCENFRLDEDTISEREKELIRAFKYAMKENANG